MKFKEQIKRLRMLSLFDGNMGHELPRTDRMGDRVVKLCYWALYAFAAIVAIAIVTSK